MRLGEKQVGHLLLIFSVTKKEAYSGRCALKRVLPLQGCQSRWKPIFLDSSSVEHSGFLRRTIFVRLKPYELAVRYMHACLRLSIAIWGRQCDRIWDSREEPCILKGGTSLHPHDWATTETKLSIPKNPFFFFFFRSYRCHTTCTKHLNSIENPSHFIH